ncbi:MAG: DUF362 domain-containing protein [Desulfobacterales bacterium]|nr:DUF362 domain-containing protein [Deltaproteobacteria bacterium]NNK96196.1 DUF362 domain-containing protein [Desulfobacterales bacterium]
MKPNTGTVWSAHAGSNYESLELLLEAAELPRAIGRQKKILIKPNLVEALDPPITTPASVVAVLIDYLLKACPGVRILVGEGTGSLEYDTFHCFDYLGYLPLCQEDRVELIDLNHLPCRHLAKASCTRWPEMYLPELIFESFLISAPVLKAHSLSQVTLTMKNMMGCAPPAHYQGNGAWGKASFHRQIHDAVFDLNRYRSPDFSLLEASVGMAQAHLWGPTCNPPVNKIAVSYDPVAIDAYGASLLKKSWRDIDHIKLAHNELGIAEPLDVRHITRKAVEQAVVMP